MMTTTTMCTTTQSLAHESDLAGEYRDRNVTSGRTVVVGVKLDSVSRVLRTWTLVKQAQPGDRFIALHILTHNGIVTLHIIIFFFFCFSFLSLMFVFCF